MTGRCRSREVSDRSATTSCSCSVSSVEEDCGLAVVGTTTKATNVSICSIAVAVQLRRHCVDSTTLITTLPTCPQTVEQELSYRKPIVHQLHKH